MHGLAVVAPDGRVVGRVAGESERVFVVESGRLRKVWRPLQKDHVRASETERCVRMQISRRDFLAAPRLRAKTPLDELLLGDFFGLED